MFSLLASSIVRRFKEAICYLLLVNLFVGVAVLVVAFHLGFLAFAHLGGCVLSVGSGGVKTLAVTDKTGRLVAIKNVTDENDLMIINKSGITIRLNVANLSVIGRATQGVRLINLEKRNDEIASVCKVLSENEEEKVEGIDEATEPTENAGQTEENNKE